MARRGKDESGGRRETTKATKDTKKEHGEVAHGTHGGHRIEAKFFTTEGTEETDKAIREICAGGGGMVGERGMS